MKYLGIVVLVIAACGKKAGDSPGTGSGSGSGSGSASPMDDFKAKITAEIEADLARLRKPETFGPGAALAFKPLPERAATPGPAYVWVKQVGLVAIDNGEAKVVVRAPETNAFDMAIDADGTPIVETTQPQRAKGGKLVNVGDDPVMAPDLLEVAPDGAVWIAYGGKLARFDGKSWTKLPPLELSEGVISLDFDGSGRAFLTTFGTVSVLDGEGWKPIIDTRTWKKGDDEIGHPLWSQALVAPSGELWLLGCWTFVRIANGKPTAMRTPEAGLSHGRFIGGVFVGSGCDDKSIVTVTPGATPKIEAHEVKSKVRTNVLVDTQDVDARGRLWAADRLEGLAIIERDGSATTLKPGSIPAVSGDVNALAVVGGGPDKLPSAAEVATGAISGKVLDHGTPVAKAMVEMCRSPSSRFVESPCSVQPDRIRGETDDAGVFRIEGPLKTYRVVAKVKDSWYVLFDKECGGIGPGGECSIGVMDTANVIK